MLNTTRMVGESVHIGPDIVVTVLGISGKRAILGVSAPPYVRIIRPESAEVRQDQFCDQCHRVIGASESRKILADKTLLCSSCGFGED